MRNRLALGAGVFFFTLAAYGCSAAPSEAPESEDEALANGESKDDAEGSTKKTTTTDSTTPAGDVPEPKPGAASGGPAPSEPGPSGTMPPPIVPTPSTPAPGPVTCGAGAVAEVEGNETPETATDLGASLSFCGELSSATDVDHLSFILPADAKSFGWNGSFSAAGATVTLTAEGVTAAPGQAPPWFPGKKYVVKVSGSAAVKYAVTMTVGR